MKQFFILSFLVGCFLSVQLRAEINPGTGYKVGDKASDFSLKNVDGSMVSLSDYEDAKGYIVVFTCNTCPFSVKYEDRINEMHHKYADAGYPVIAINPNDPSIKAGDSYEAMKTRAKDKAFKFPYVFDDGQKVFPMYGATKTPHVYILDQDMIVKYIGAIDDNAGDADMVDMNYVDNAISSLGKGIDPDPASTKAIGCSIKYKKS